MSDPAGSNQVDIKVMNAKYDASVRGVEFELELFWKRSLFFWGFIGGALVAFSAADKHLLLQSVIASFGFVCSMVWTLANRGSKYWYESWEAELVRAEIAVTGRLYGYETPEKTEKEYLKKWLQGRRYSPSRLTIALSDYVVFLWLCLLVSMVARIVSHFQCMQISKDCLAWLTCSFILFSIAYAVLLLRFCHVKNEKAKTQPPS
jgi:hypothetical protein